MRRTLKVLSALLSYPTAELQAAVPEMRAALDAERRLPQKNRDRLDRLLEEIGTHDLYDLQERYVLLIDAKDVKRFAELCERERCPFSVVGDITDDGWLKVGDPLLKDPPVDLPLNVMLGKPPKMTRDVKRLPPLGDDAIGEIAHDAQRQRVVRAVRIEARFSDEQERVGIAFENHLVRAAFAEVQVFASTKRPPPPGRRPTSMNGSLIWPWCRRCPSSS